MQTIIWAFGSMLVLMLILSFLSIGYTFKGKLSIVLASLVLSLGGSLAASSFSLILTILLIISLVFFTAYFLDRRAGSLIYIGNTVSEEGSVEEIENVIPFDSKIELVNEEISLIPPELEVVKSNEINVLEDVNDQSAQNSRILEKNLAFEEITEILDEDISSYLEENTDLENLGQDMETEPEDTYLSDIESLLVEEVEMNHLKDEQEILDEDENITSLDKADTLLYDSSELKQLDDFTLDILIAEQEAAVGRNEDIEILNKDKSLQK
ncbi:hypothetical protein [Bacillus salipaludis]|uniref:Uncharacterized protein n=1 Tax=Bacillus salipaludis TaxID=2547811 RepID=A0AA90R7P9_9BACI|nr:hypothetical protein [Bacillus salipaludis]MDQ6599831.1 hypothetical protein [Bacillus salipaludis]